MSYTNYISQRETEVLHMIAYEHSTQEIASTLLISPHTVISHRKNMIQKLKVKNMAGLIRRSIELGLLRLSETEQQFI